MDTGKAQGIAFGTVALIVIAGSITDITSEKSKAFDSIPRRVFGSMMLGALLMLVAIPAPKASASLSGLIALSYLFLSDGGSAFIKSVNRTLGGSVTFGYPDPNANKATQKGGAGGGARAI